MKVRPYKTWTIAFVLCVIVATIGVVWVDANRSDLKAMLGPYRIDATSLQPGTSIGLKVGGRDVEVSVPEEEAFTLGTFQVGISSLEFVSGPIERDGSLESVWIADVNGDAKEDGIFVIRNGGSGSYVDIVVLESGGGRFTMRRLPPVSSATITGYMGHDAVSIRNGSVTRSFPTYVHKRQMRIDRQWKPESGLRGVAPIKVKPDSNAGPSGSTVELQFNYANGRWEKA